jgi:DNA modification methylase
VKIPISHIEVLEKTPIEDVQQLQELADSMREHGLSHPILVRRANNSADGNGEKFVLASGEKRLHAAVLLGWTEIEAEVRDLTVDKAKEIRIHENLKRFNLPWWDQVKLVEELHLLRQTEHGVPTRGRPAKDEQKVGWTVRDTAEELGVGIGPLSEDLTLARALRRDSNLMKVKDKKTALRLARIAANRHQAEIEATLPSQLEGNQVYFGDSATILQNFPANSIDHSITDPPWLRFFDNSLTLDDRTLPVFKELYRVLKFGSFLYIFCGLDDYHYYAGWDEPNPDDPNEKVHHRGKLETIGFQVANTPVIWQKENALSRRGVRSWEYDRDFEFIIVAAKGNPALVTSRRLSGVKKFPIVPPVKMIHPNEKPLALIEDLVTDCSYEGNLIIDPFAGSGALGEACKKNDRKFILCEREHKFYQQICKRMEIR